MAAAEYAQSPNRAAGHEPDLFRASGLAKTYRGSSVLAGFDLEVDGGEILAVTGANGSGKSTLLRCLAGAAPLDAGTIRIRGLPSGPSSGAHWRSVFGVLDDFGWLPDLTVTDHLMLMCAEPDGHTAVSEALTRFGVGDLGDRLPDSLSAGQRQRAILAAAHVRPWTVLLLDEPERHLDAQGVHLLAGELHAMVAGRQRCAIVVTHSAQLLELLDCDVLDLARHRGQDHR